VLAYERVRDETGREMHKSWGNAIEANEAFERMGSDIVRWLFCAQPPSQNVNFGYGPADEVKRRLLTFWNSVGFLVTYANIARWRPEWGAGPASERALDRWLAARTAALVRDAEDAYERYSTPRLTALFEAFVDDLSNWYIRRSRRRFWNGEPEALATLWWSLVQALRVVSPAMPFLADHLWRILVAGPCEGAPDSVHLSGWPDAVAPDDGLLAEVGEVRRVVELGRQARAQSGLKLRQPLRRMAVFGAPLAEAHRDEVGDELRVKEVRFERGGEARVRLKPNLPVLGPRLGKRLPDVRRALEEGRFELRGDEVVVDGEVLRAEDVLRERLPVNTGWAVAGEGDVSVELDTTLDDELLLEAQVLDLIHRLNAMRREAGLELTDRIVVTLPESQRDLLAHEDWIKDEVLAVEIRLDGATAEPQIARAS
jgi:isoleucyl-tRNA synthetase